MGTIKLAQALRRRRLALAVGAALALLIAIAGVYKVSLAPPGLASKEATTGFATQRLLIDTPDSLLGDSYPLGSTGAAFRASYLGNLVGGEATHDAVAARMQLDPAEIAIVGSGAAPPGTMSPAAIKAVEASPPLQKYVLSYNEVPGLPLLNVFATAPTEAAARALARSGGEALAQTAAEGGPATSSARIRRIGWLSSGAKASGPRKSQALVMAVVFFIFWLFAVLAVDRVLRARRRQRLEAAFGGWPA
jgi:hypothetical protein